MGKIRARALLVFVTLLALAWMAQGALAEEASLAERLGFTATGFDFAKVDLVLAAGILIVLCVVLYAVLAVFLKPQQGQSYEAPQELTVEGITGGETTPPRDESNPVMKFYYSLEDGWYNFLDGLNQVIPVYKIIDPIDQVIPSFALFLLLLLLLLVGGLYWGGAFNAPGPDGTGGGVLWPVVDWMGSLLGWKKADAAGVQFLVSDEQANPVAGAQVAVAYGEQAESYSTNEFGEFSMPVYQAEIFLDVQAEGFERFSENYSVNREGVNRVSLKRAPLYFAENRVLELVDEFGARVTEAVFVSFSCSGSYNAPASQSTTTGEVSVTYTGNCGTLMASIRAQGFEDQTVLMSGSRTVAVLKKKSADRLNGKLNVKLLGPQSESMTGMEIRLFDNDNIWKNTGKSDAAGSYSFTVTPGTYYVLVQDLAGKFTSTQSNKVPVDAGEEVLVEVRMSKAGTDGSGGDGGGTTCAPGKTLCANGQCQTSCGPGVLPACPAGQNRCADRTCQASCGPGPINCPTGTNLCQNGTCNATCPVPPTCPTGQTRCMDYSCQTNCGPGNLPTCPTGQNRCADYSCQADCGSGPGDGGEPRKVELKLVDSGSRAGIQGVNVDLYLEGIQLVSNARTNSEGGVVFANADRVKPYSIVASGHPSYVMKIVSGIQSQLLNANPIVIELEKLTPTNSGEVAVKVTELGAGNVKQAEVFLYNKLLAVPIVRGLTADDGSASFPGLPAGTYSAMASKGLTQGRSAEGTLAAGSRLELAVQLVLMEGGLKARVKDAQGNGVQAAKVEYYNLLDNRKVGEAITDVTGLTPEVKLKINVVPYLAVSKTGFYTKRTAETELTPNVTKTVDVTLSREQAMGPCSPGQALCANGQCANSCGPGSNPCQAPNNLCSNGTCSSACPVPLDCPVGQNRCADFSCQASCGPGIHPGCPTGQSICLDGSCQANCGPGPLPSCPVGQVRCNDRTCQASCGPGPINCPTGTNLCQNGTCNATCPVPPTCPTGQTRCMDYSCQTNCGPGNLPTCPTGQNRCADYSCQASCGVGPLPQPAGEISVRLQEILAEDLKSQARVFAKNTAYWLRFSEIIPNEDNKQVQSVVRTGLESQADAVSSLMVVRDAKAPGVSVVKSSSFDPANNYADKSVTAEDAKQARFGFGDAGKGEYEVMVKSFIKNTSEANAPVEIRFGTKAEVNGVPVEKPAPGQLYTRSYRLGELISCDPNDVGCTNFVYAFYLSDLTGKHFSGKIPVLPGKSVEVWQGLTYSLEYRIFNAHKQGKSLSNSVLSFTNADHALDVVPPSIPLASFEVGTSVSGSVNFTPRSEAAVTSLAVSLNSSEPDSRATLSFSVPGKKQFAAVLYPKKLVENVPANVVLEVSDAATRERAANALVKVSTAEDLSNPLAAALTEADGVAVFSVPGLPTGSRLFASVEKEFYAKKTGLVWEVLSATTSFVPDPSLNCLSISPAKLSVHRTFGGEFSVSARNCDEEAELFVYETVAGTPLKLVNKSESGARLSLTTAPNARLPKNGSLSIGVMTEGSTYQGDYLVNVRARFAGQQEFRNLGRVEVTVGTSQASESCYGLSKASFDIFHRPDDAVITNRCFQAVNDAFTPRLTLSSLKALLQHAGLSSLGKIEFYWSVSRANPDGSREVIVPATYAAISPKENRRVELADIESELDSLVIVDVDEGVDVGEEAEDEGGGEEMELEVFNTSGGLVSTDLEGTIVVAEYIGEDTQQDPLIEVQALNNDLRGLEPALLTVTDYVKVADLKPFTEMGFKYTVTARGEGIDVAKIFLGTISADGERHDLGGFNVDALAGLQGVTYTVSNDHAWVQTLFAGTLTNQTTNPDDRVIARSAVDVLKKRDVSVALIYDPTWGRKYLRQVCDNLGSVGNAFAQAGFNVDAKLYAMGRKSKYVKCDHELLTWADASNTAYDRVRDDVREAWGAAVQDYLKRLAPSDDRLIYVFVLANNDPTGTGLGARLPKITGVSAPERKRSDNCLANLRQYAEQAQQRQHCAANCSQYNQDGGSKSNEGSGYDPCLQCRYANFQSQDPTCTNLSLSRWRKGGEEVVAENAAKAAAEKGAQLYFFYPRKLEQRSRRAYGSRKALDAVEVMQLAADLSKGKATSIKNLGNISVDLVDTIRVIQKSLNPTATETFHVLLRAGDTDVCYGPNDIEGLTGENAFPRALFSWNAAKIQADTCSKSSNKVAFCDASQFSLSLIKRLLLVQQLYKEKKYDDVENLLHDEVYLKPDGYTADLLSDLDEYLRSQAFFETPSGYLQWLKEYFSSPGRLEFVSDNHSLTPLPSAGLYRMDISIEFPPGKLGQFMESDEPVAFITVKLNEVVGMPTSNLFERLPLDGAIVETSREGYGVSYTGDRVPIRSDEGVEARPIPGSDNLALVRVAHRTDFEYLNNEARSFVFHAKDNLDGTVDWVFSPSHAAPALLKVEGRPERAEAYYKVVDAQGASVDVGAFGSLWTGIASSLFNCADFSGKRVFYKRADARNAGCAKEKSGYNYGFSWLPTGGQAVLDAGAVYLRTIFYTPVDQVYSVKNVCASGEPLIVSTAQTLDNFDEFIGLKHNLEATTLSDMFEKVKARKMCLKASDNEVRLWWNEDELYKELAANYNDHFDSLAEGNADFQACGPEAAQK